MRSKETFETLVRLVAAVLRGCSPQPLKLSPELIDRAGREGVEGILAEAAGPGYQSPFLEVQSLNSRRHLAELRRLEKILASAGLKVLVLKGGALLSTVYQSRPSWRTIGDLDLLPPAQSYDQVRNLLLQSGYQEENGILNRKGLWIDLHLDLLGAERVPARATVYAFREEDLWASAAPLLPGDRALFQLGRSQLFAHLAVHALKHSCERLSWLVDMALLWPLIDPDDLYAWGTRTRSWRAICLSLHLLQSMFGQAYKPPAPSFWEKVYLKLVRQGRQPRIAGELLTAMTRPAYLLDLLWPRNGATFVQRLGQLAQAARAEAARLQ